MVSKKTQSMLMSIALVVFIGAALILVWQTLKPAELSAVPVAPGGIAPATGPTAPSSPGCEGYAPLGTSQNMQVIAVDHAQTGTAITTTATNVYEGGIIIKSALAESTNQPTTPGTTYRLFTTKSGYFNTVNDITTSCVLADQKFTVKLPNVDGSAALSFVNADTGLLNADTTSQQAIGSGQGVTMTFRLTGGEAYAYVTDPAVNRYTVTLQFSNLSVFDSSLTELQGCSVASIPLTEAGVAHKAWVCEGNPFNFDKQEFQLRVTALTGQNPADGDDLTFKVYPMGRVLHTIDGSVMGMSGGVVENNVGTAAYTPISGVLYVE